MSEPMDCRKYAIPYTCPGDYRLKMRSCRRLCPCSKGLSGEWGARLVRWHAYGSHFSCDQIDLDIFQHIEGAR